jgi:hypothetical protein
MGVQGKGAAAPLPLLPPWRGSRFDWSDAAKLRAITQQDEESFLCHDRFSLSNTRSSSISC